MKAIFIFAFVFFSSHFLSAQTDKQTAEEKGREAIRLMDNGQFEESLKLLEEAQKLDPDDIIYPYEMSYAYYADKKYDKAIEILEGLTTRPDVIDLVFQMLGNSYDDKGESEKALKAYARGLEKFPASGRLYLETGMVHMRKKEYSEALGYYEKGIEIDPEFPSNYYRAAQIFLTMTQEEVWGMIYGEIFMNLERNSARTTEMSKHLFDTYKSEIKFTSDTSSSVSFSKNSTISVPAGGKDFKLPFGMLVYEQGLIMGIGLERTINLASLDRIRQRFVEFYFQNEISENYPNVLFDYQQKVLKAGHMEAYNHWILMKGDEDEFEKWRDENEEKWKSFIQWFSANPLKLDANNRFYRTQY
jgi:tetratricopeptide (TPR) repeat protein